MRAEVFVRQLSGRTRLDLHGCCWSVRSANALKSIREMRHANPIMDRLLAEICADDVFLDVGANFGAYAIRAARHDPAPRRVYAIEPSAGPYLALLENIALNGCHDLCQPLPVVVGAADGFVEFKIDSLDPSTATSHVLSNREASHRPTGALWDPCPITTRVPCCGIDGLVAGGVIEAPTIAKIDVEGYEGEAFKGMRESAASIRWLAVEIHPDRLVGTPSVDALLQEISEMGFEADASDSRGRQEHYLFRSR
jgi:FkbM family methyltransferase